MRKSIDRMELVHDFLKRAVSGSLHAKRILSLAKQRLVGPLAPARLLLIRQASGKKAAQAK